MLHAQLLLVLLPACALAFVHPSSATGGVGAHALAGADAFAPSGTIDTSEYPFRVTDDWFNVNHNLGYWESFVLPLRGSLVHALEIGSFQGLSAVWLLQHVLTHPLATITCVDTFQGPPDYTSLQRWRMRALFDHNTRPFRGRVRVHAGRSADMLPQLTGPYDLIYIDGDHHSTSVLQDGVLAFPLLKPGGLLIFDDYGWKPHPDPDDVRNPRRGIDAFLQVYAEEVEVLASAYQLYVRKRS